MKHKKHIANIQSHFVAPWARGYGLAKAMVDFAISSSKENYAKCLQLDVEKHKRQLFIFLSQKDLLSGVKIHIMPLLMESLSKDYIFIKIS